MQPLRLAIDFDDTIMHTQNVVPGYKMGRPIPGAVEAMNKLKAEGAILVIHSVWADTEQKVRAMSEWLRYFNIPYDFITNKKPVVDCYIDDHGYHFENWRDTIKYLRTLNPES